MDFIKNNLLWRDGKYIAFAILVSAVFSFFIFKPLLIIISLFFLFCLYFFRNPDRSLDVNGANVLVCPADGKIVDIVNANIEGSIEGYSKKVSIFLSPLDVHVNWIPYSGIVKEIVYRAGKFVVAYAPKSSDINERNDIIIQCNNGKVILVRQIAGIVARRICCWIKKGDALERGQKFGMIRFGSRVDVLLPANVEISVILGQYVQGGHTILGKWS